MKHVLIMTLFATVAVSGPLYLEDGFVVSRLGNPQHLSSSDPRKAVVADADESLMQPFQDARGAYRWKRSGKQIVYIQPGDRTPIDVEKALQAISDYLIADAALAQALAKGWNVTRPAIYQRLQRWVSEKQQTAAELMRNGQAADDPTPPAKTTIPLQ